MKKTISLFLAVLMICALAGCKGAADPGSESQTESTTQEQAVTTADGITIDYGTSELYTKDDMDKAIEVIQKRFDQWEGFQMKSYTFGTDEECNEKNVAWMNQLEAANEAQEVFTQCIMFKSDFHTAKECNNGFEDDTDYEGFQWWLGRADDGDWKLMTWGN